ncbi:MAG: iron ABC transporter permease [Nitriliruptorales bacterium]|nr:iron ABC transporter permease [Nitriliruptorales bacterium]
MAFDSAATLPSDDGVTGRARVPGLTRLTPGWLVGGIVVAVGAVLAGSLVGPAGLAPGPILLELLDRLPFVQLDSSLSPQQAAVLTQIRLPRVVLGLLVGAALAASGAAYQGVFRNPLADPYLLGAAAGAGLGATLVIVAGLHDLPAAVPAAAFLGAGAAVAATWTMGRTVGGRSITSVILAGVAVASFLTAVQTFVQQRNVETLREVWSWILGSLATATWDDVVLVVPWLAISLTILLAHRRHLDVLSVGEEEASALGIDAPRVRTIVVVAATAATAAAVAVSGLIGFVGIIVPHAIRLAAGGTYRRVLPLAVLLGGAFLVIADVLARLLMEPAELPIGVVTAFFGAPFFAVVLRASSRGAA